MSVSNSDKVFDALAIRDTSNHNGTTVALVEYRLKTIIIENGLNQTVTFQCQGSANDDFSNNFNIGASFDVTATTNTFQTCDSYFPYMRLTAICGTAPTTGALTVYFIEYEG